MLPPVTISSVTYPQSLGAILSIAADSHGKAVYAVGGPSTGTAAISTTAAVVTAPVLVYSTAISGTTAGTAATANQGAIAIPVASGAFNGPLAGTILVRGPAAKKHGRAMLPAPAAALDA